MHRATTAAWDVAPPRAVRTPLRGEHAVNVVGRGLDADEDDRVAGLLGLHRAIGIEDGLADRRSGRCVQALAQQPVAHLLLGSLVEARQQELDDLRRLDPLERLLLA